MTPRDQGRGLPVAFRIAVVYAVLASLWILFSDAAVRAVAPNEQAAEVLQTAKGWLFVAVTAFILLGVVGRYVRRVEAGEREARAAAEKLGVVVDTVPGGILIIGLDGVITFANDVAARVTGVSKQDLVGRSIDDPSWGLITPDGGSPVPAERAFTRAREGESVFGVPLGIHRPHGERIVLSVSAAPMKAEDGTVTAVVAAFEDVTSASEADRRIVHLNRIYSMLSQINKAMVRVTDVRELYAEACRVTVEYGEFRMAWIGLLDERTGDVVPTTYAGAEEGYLEEVHVNVNDEEAGRGPAASAVRMGRTAVSNDVEHDPTTRVWSRSALKRGYRSVAAFPLKQGDRTYGALVIYASTPGFFDAAETRLLQDLTADIAFGVSHILQNEELRGTMEALSAEVAAKNDLVRQLSDDVAARTTAERNLRAANDALDAVVDGSPLPIIALDAEARIVVWNGAAERLFGWRRDEVLGKVGPGLSEDDLARQLQMLGVVLEGERLEGVEQRLPRKDGRMVDLLVSADAVAWPGSPGPVAVAALQDVTERNRFEQLKADFVSAVSHELRTPLTGVVGYADMLRRDGAVDPASCREMAEHISEKANELQALIERLLEAASLQAGATQITPVRTEPGELVRGVADRTIVPDGFTLDVDVAVEPPCVMADGMRLAQVLDGLVSNAFKYSPKGGHVVIGARAEDGRLVLWVRDEGIGIRPEEADTIFERFTQADMSSTRMAGGLGLGLYLARQVVEAHGGSITVDSAPGAGSTFTISLPMEPC